MSLIKELAREATLLTAKRPHIKIGKPCHHGFQLVHHRLEEDAMGNIVEKPAYLIVLDFQCPAGLVSIDCVGVLEDRLPPVYRRAIGREDALSYMRIFAAISADSRIIPTDVMANIEDYLKEPKPTSQLMGSQIEIPMLDSKIPSEMATSSPRL